MIVFLEDRKKAMYTPEEIFSIPWVKKLAYVEFSLPKVFLTYRIFKERADRFRIMTKFKNEPAWSLGHCKSINESRYRIYYHIINFRLYVTGKWAVHDHSTLYERYIDALRHVYPTDFLEKIPLDSYHGMTKK
jgi:hypothetical protein